MSKLLIILALVFLLPSVAPAVNFYDGARTQGLYLLSYTSFYDADTFADGKGNAGLKGYGYSKLEELLRVCYYKGDLVLTGFAPFGRVRSGRYQVSSSGVGDINLGAGCFLPIRKADVLPMLFVEFPTGAYDSAKAVNYGSHQYDIKPAVFLFKQMGAWSVDAAAKYFFRTENPGTRIAPGNELHLQGLLGYRLSKGCKVGPSLSWMRSAAQEDRGVRVSGSAREMFSAGADLYVRLPFAAVTFTYLRDIKSRNTTRGDFFQIKTCTRF
ncbi:MAG TPA: transporter [Candidatus Omnitrophota bacterium]|nr:transporter [Candidatus Omnitrophota bacterium]HRZ14342.1 transporter [Candidatus Omnitrophota bacterium]